MFLIDDESRAALDGSRPADEVVVWAWFDGALAWPEPLQVVSWSRSGSAESSSKVQQQVKFTIADPSVELSPWRLDDVLGVAGTLLQVMYKVGGAGVLNVGWFRVEGNAPDEMFTRRRVAEYGLVVPDSPVAPHERDLWVSSGSVVDVDAVDLTIFVDRDKFLAPESPRGTSPTIVSEIRRLVGDYFPVVVHPDVVDRAVAKTLVYERERLEAVQDLAGRIDARYRMNGDGALEVYPKAPGPVVWRVEPNDGLVEAKRSQSVDGLYNLWQVSGKEDASGSAVTGSVSITSGPLRVRADGQGHGRVPYEYSSEMITTRVQAVAYAETLRLQQARSMAIELTVTTVPHPELQAGDRIEVGCPVIEGHIVYLPGEIISISSSGSPIPGPTSMTVSCAYSDVMAALSRTDWADNLTREKPDLTWDRMPSSWGKAPAMSWNDLP